MTLDGTIRRIAAILITAANEPCTYDDRDRDNHDPRDVSLQSGWQKRRFAGAARDAATV